MAPNAGSSMLGSGSAASATSRGRGSSSISSILPSLLDDQRHEANAPEILVNELATRSLGDLDQFLHPAGFAHRHDDPAAVGELVNQSLGHVASARRREDRIERRAVETASSAVAFDDRDIGAPEARQPLAGEFRQIVLPLDSDHLSGNSADDGGGIA